MDDVELSTTGPGYYDSRTAITMHIFEVSENDHCLRGHLEGVLVTSVSGLLNGGPTVVIRGFLIGWVGTISVHSSLGALASMAPTFWWTIPLDRNDGSALLELILSLRNRIADNDDESLRRLHFSSSYSWVLWSSRPFGVFRATYLAVRGFYNLFQRRRMSSQGLSCLVGFPAIATSIVGADCAMHIALLYTILINMLFAFGMIIALMFCIGDVTVAIESADTLFYPFPEIFYQAAKSTTGAGLLAGIVLALGIASSIDVYATASHMLWSFSRDLGLQFSGYLVQVIEGVGRLTPRLHL
ncbi:hypothetical protein RRF57_004728 [Xylaria bambusicola]|uniref:Uncharacterized protein n=1 Tax=Xylaria bambusicola TaxID=326684 RepID=A0AAN7UKF7_9PEZI